jgi:hypothetical protein
MLGWVVAGEWQGGSPFVLGEEQGVAAPAGCKCGNHTTMFGSPNVYFSFTRNILPPPDLNLPNHPELLDTCTTAG